MKTPTITKLLMPSFMFAISQIVVCFELYLITIDDTKFNNSYVTKHLYDVSRVQCVGSCALDEPCKTASWHQYLLECVLSDTGLDDVNWNGDGFLEIAPGWLTFATGGEPMADLIYINVTVRQGKDWEWGDEGGGGFGEITLIEDDGWVRVDWDNGYWENYRMGAENAYDLMIVEGWFDFARCGNATYTK